MCHTQCPVAIDCGAHFQIDSIFISHAKLRQKVSQSLFFGGDNLMQRLTDSGNQHQ